MLSLVDENMFVRLKNVFASNENTILFGKLQN